MLDYSIGLCFIMIILWLSDSLTDLQMTVNSRVAFATKNVVVQVPRTVTEDVCVPVTVSQPRQDCRLVAREECDIMEMDETYQHCSVISDPREKTEKKCSYKVKSKNSQLL